MILRDKYAFIGVGLTKLGKIPGKTTDELAARAIELAFEDAGIQKNEVDGFILQSGIGGGLNDNRSLRLAGINAPIAWQVPGLGSNAIVMVSMAIGAMEAGLCRTCVHTETCTFPRDPSRPVCACDEYCAEAPALRPVETAPKSNHTANEPDSAGKGLCATCKWAETCHYPKPEDGVRDCDEYV